MTRPVRFSGSELRLNFATSAVGSVRVEIQAAGGQPVPGFSFADCPEIYGDEIDHPVAWKSDGNLSRLAGTPIRLRFVLKDADLYAFRFAD